MRIPIETIRLPNGLFVTLSEDHTAPIVAVNLWYHVGSANERPGRTGFAHLFEHMLFQGSADVEANEHFELVQRAGGTLNGSTWLERTNYFETVPSNQLELALWLEANRMGKLLPAMTQQKLDTQREVVMNERRWTMDNQPYGTWMEKLPALCFPPEHPFHHSLIGSMEDLAAASLDDVAQFFATYYTPDNAVLSIAGDFEPAQARGARRTAFRKHSARARESRRCQTCHCRRCSASGSARSSRTRSCCRDSFSRFGRRRSGPTSTMPPACAAPCSAFATRAVSAAASCASGRSRPTRRRSRTIWPRAATCSSSTSRLDRASPAEQLEQEVAHEIDAIVRDGVEPAEVERAVALIQTAFVTAMQQAGERADRVSMFATYFGNPELINDEVDRYQAVTAEAVNAFARARLGENNRASLLYVPRDASPGELVGTGVAAEAE